MHQEAVDIKPILIGDGVQDISLVDTLQQIQYIQRAVGENQQAVKILTGAGDAQEVKVIPGLGEQIVSLAATTSAEGSQPAEISYIESGSVPEGAAVQEVTYVQQPQQDGGGTHQALLNVQETGDVQTIMVELPYGQELDANSIMTLLQQHQQ